MSGLGISCLYNLIKLYKNRTELNDKIKSYQINDNLDNLNNIKEGEEMIISCDIPNTTLLKCYREYNYDYDINDLNNLHKQQYGRLLMEHKFDNNKYGRYICDIDLNIKPIIVNNITIEPDNCKIMIPSSIIPYYFKTYGYQLLESHLVNSNTLEYLAKININLNEKYDVERYDIVGQVYINITKKNDKIVYDTISVSLNDLIEKKIFRKQINWTNQLTAINCIAIMSSVFYLYN